MDKAFRYEVDHRFVYIMYVYIVSVVFGHTYQIGSFKIFV